jgi:hypothetical protein
MAELGQISFSHREVVEALLKKHGIHNGIWGIFIKFGIKGANFGASPSDVLPTAIVPILEIGLQRFKEENNIAVDAAKVNPEPQPGKKARTSRRSKTKATEGV